jgi:hypothetical protein
MVSDGAAYASACGGRGLVVARRGRSRKRARVAPGEASACDRGLCSAASREGTCLQVVRDAGEIRAGEPVRENTGTACAGAA